MQKADPGVAWKGLNVLFLLIKEKNSTFKSTEYVA